MSAENDPSMDDILASIRKIISDDEARAQVSGNAAPPAPPANAPAEFRSAGQRTAGNGSREDVLLLTDLIEEPTLAAVEPAPVPPTPIPLQRIDPVSASEMPQPPFESAPTSRPAETPPPTPPSAPAFEQPLVGSSVAGAATSAFDRLNQVVEERKAAPAAAPPAPAIPLGAGGKTIEDLVKEMLRPMLKDWIDRSLPPMVEELVEREIARLTRR
jgi:cell pole-organizing protein PopZ